MSKLKANELMIGDWVQDITPVVIDAISNEDICTYRTEHGYITANPSNLKPIPLTKEILKKNGFRQVMFDFVLDMMHIRRDENVECFYIVVGGKGTRIDYVHELQHALRLCGIDKEIVL